ncbi:3-keto-5-aminohexanoate cleavage protein [Blastomonas fulva]|uniref:3-keto-5-aminohexanoate cleavage protein n=1 Tax=Blastomonas fulva TaxID=1550728 RepID=UPI0025A3D46F|nr:3-keto-5-aminohexanoate cleavage protein [Blastomonas fulva]MDM7928497.1 3-keto-5-aminohexanoate cleavage protein [Blastomonas fulva]MDM7967337.1 3-keto-5-aminohexanoate cleavage protein [Blastomonas fulva]
MKHTGKAIITCAVTGSIHTPSMSPYLPVTPDEIAEQAIEAVEAGAAVLHLHARDPIDGRPSPDPALYMQFLPRIKQQTDAIINITTGGAPGFSEDDRMAGPLAASPEMTSLNMGSMNFGFWPLADKFDWKHEWERELMLGSKRFPANHNFALIERIMTELGEGHGTRFEYECYDIGHLYSVKHFADLGLIKPPFLIQGIFGILGGLGAELENFFLMKQTADRLFDDDYIMSCFAVGRPQMKFLAQCALVGGSVRVGLEDSLYIGKGELAVSNAQQVRKVRQILDALDIPIATPEEAREILGTKGGDRVAF